MATQTTSMMRVAKNSRFATLFAEFWPDEESWNSMTPPVIAGRVSPRPHQMSLAAKMSEILWNQTSPPTPLRPSHNINRCHSSLHRRNSSPAVATMPGTFLTSIPSPTPPTTSHGSTTSFQTAISHQAPTNDEWTSFSMHDAKILQSRLDAAGVKVKWSYDEANRHPPSSSCEMSRRSSDELDGDAKLHLDVGAQVKEPWSYDRANRAVQEQLQYASSLGFTVEAVQDIFDSPEEATPPETASTVTKKRLSPNAKEFVPSAAVNAELKLAMARAKEFVPGTQEQAAEELDVMVGQREQFETWEAFQQWQAWVADQGFHGQNNGGYADTVAVEDSVSCVGGGGGVVTRGGRERASSLEEMYVGAWVFPEDGLGEPVWVEQRYASFQEQGYQQEYEQEEEQWEDDEPYEVNVERWLDMGDDEFCLA